MPGARVKRLQQPVDLLALHRLNPRRYPFLLESVGADLSAHGRHDILFAFPAESLTLDAAGLHSDAFAVQGDDFLDNLQRWWSEERLDPPSALPFNGGWFLFLGYELASQVEPKLRLPSAPGTFPTAVAVRCPAAIVRNHADGDTVLVDETGGVLESQILADLRQAGAPGQGEVQPLSARLREEDAGRFLGAVAQIQEYIRAGDVFQVNLSRHWMARFDREPDPALLYARLREENPAPFCGLLRWDQSAILCSSPERLVRSAAGWVETRPIAGTRPRLAAGADRDQTRALLANPKERAEHIMLIDLERNDLGRVCEPGSVEVNELMTVESYAHVHHIVSNVRGRLRPNTGPGSIIRAVFPGGTITGCPKVRCMEIIAELEGEGRGIYTGSMGYLDRSGAFDLNILIRSLLLQGATAEFRTGAGIVADSDAQRELEETRAKARGLLQAFGCAA